MIAGHFGFAAAVKSRARATPLWALMLATVWLDVVFIPLFVAKIEPIDPVPGTDGGYGEVIIHADYTHSLVGALVIAAAFGLVAAIFWGKRVGAVLGAVVFSHWLLDLPMHRADMPIMPGAPPGALRLGLGLWRSPVGSFALELALVVAGVLLYWRAAVATAESAGEPQASRLARRAYVTAVVLLVSGMLTLTLNVLDI
jgi:membrane-bound metal-dependent hydrolase YbcI (DUF457 family)